ncbi:hypothetical protein ABZW32_18160 [Streptomyces sp. NPDC004667]|uniref:hypothetical protein n=1 Tax=Streptomyces sp. NPDC004667 TaxID=3154285 RepID=UPI0033B35A44
MRLTSSLATAGIALGLVGALAGGATAYAPAPSADAKAATSPAGATARPTTGKVVHFGYDGAGNTYQSPTLDLSDPKAKDPANYLPKKLVDSARAAEAAKTSGTAAAQPNAAAALLCTLYVGGLRDWNLGDLQGTTNQDCSGSFRVQHTNGQFAWNNGGWSRITGSIVGPQTTGQHNDTVFMVWCNHPAGYGRKSYRLEARGYATASDGTPVNGYLQYGGSSTWTCL